ncbi:MAG TPA: hypothetical protein VND88_06970 [Candidatus Acidoferrales bacterium]|nr:hypothetical protein [Candidatus Acidoferrales bacterium]
MAKVFETKEFDAAVWEVTPGARETEAVRHNAAKVGVDVLSFIAVGTMLMGLGVINTGWIASSTSAVIFPVIVAAAIGLAGLAIHAVVGRRLALAGGLGFMAALGLTYVLLGAPTLLAAAANADIAHALAMTFMIWAIVGAIVTVSLLARHFFMAAVFVMADIALWVVMVSYLSPSTLSANLAGYLSVIAAGLAFLVGLVAIVWPAGLRWPGGAVRLS